MRFPLAELERRFSALYSLYSIIVCPSDFGLPIRRPRRYTLMVLKGVVQFHGNLEDFLQKFKAIKLMDCVDLFKAPVEHQQDVLVKQARRHSAEVARSWTQTLSPGALQRYEDCTRAFSSRYGSSSSTVVDIDHNASIHRGGQTHLPSLVTHGTLWCLSEGRPAVGAEHMMAQGVPMFDGACPWTPDTIASLTEAQLKKLAGNGMHVNVVGLLLIYVLCHLTVCE